MTIPTKPAAYWRPEVSLTDVYYLRGDGTWWHSPNGTQVSEADVPNDLQHLGDYSQPYRDPEPYVSGLGNRHRENFNPAIWTFEPRPGYSQSIEDYD